ncbi:MAG: thioredoxin family protein [Alphaproteobacteria bacterium]
MVLMHTPAATQNTKAPDFKLHATNGNTYTLSDCMGKNGLLVMFICNHCPYVLAIIDRLTQTCKTLQDHDIGCVAIMPNDTQAYPKDSFENMKLFATQHTFTFPYLIDKKQEIAKAYDAVCTPDFFGFDKDGQLQYRGRLDSASANSADENTVPELLNAFIQIKNNGISNERQNPSMGCSIKWKKG